MHEEWMQSQLASARQEIERLMAGRYRVAKKEDRTCDGIVFMSKHEMEAYQAFRILEKHRAIAKLELQVAYPLYAAKPKPDGTFEAVQFSKYVADFRVTENDGTIRIYDAKGHATAEYKRSKKVFEINYPQLRIVEC
jgi:hypothetical protein